jgi:hypothetical protein
MQLDARGCLALTASRLRPQRSQLELVGPGRGAFDAGAGKR